MSLDTVRKVTLGLMHIFAAPVYVMRTIVRTIRTIVRFQVVRAGVVTCPHCTNQNALDIFATCRRCGVNEFGSRLRCSNCRQLTPAFACDFCGGLIRVL